MPEGVTSDQIVQAARELSQEEFTRGDLAEKLGVPKPRIRKGFRQARKSGRLEKVRDDEENTSFFRLTGE
jgi:DNA-binding transcriptional regulator LsrR (DeoR family)